MWTHTHTTHTCTHSHAHQTDTRTRALTPRGRPACAHCWHTAFPGTNRLRGGLCRFERKRTLGRGGGAGVPGGREELGLRRVPGWQGRVQGGWAGTGGGPRGGRAVSPRQSPGGAYKDGPAAPASTGAPRRQEHQQALEHHFGRSTTPEGAPPRKEHQQARSSSPGASEGNVSPGEPGSPHRQSPHRPDAGGETNTASLRPRSSRAGHHSTGPQSLPPGAKQPWEWGGRGVPRCEKPRDEDASRGGREHRAPAPRSGRTGFR